MYIFEKALEYIFLPCCGVCGKLKENYLCEKCKKELEKFMICEEKIKFNQKKQTNIEKMHIFEYQGIIRNLILKYKFNDKAYLYKTFCEFIIKNKKVLDFIRSYDIIIPVPIHKKRLKERGYNQSELIVRELGKRLKLKIYTDVLIKIKNNKPQSTLNKKERVENTKNVYKLINSEKISNKKILLFDDIYTTGTTINECAKELIQAKINKIGVLTLAKD